MKDICFTRLLPFCNQAGLISDVEVRTIPKPLRYNFGKNTSTSNDDEDDDDDDDDDDDEDDDADDDSVWSRGDGG